MSTHILNVFCIPRARIIEMQFTISALFARRTPRLKLEGRAEPESQPARNEGSPRGLLILKKKKQALQPPRLSISDAL